jgi:hypothetical protein
MIVCCVPWVKSDLCTASHYAAKQVNAEWVQFTVGFQPTLQGWQGGLKDVFKQLLSPGNNVVVHCRTGQIRAAATCAILLAGASELSCNEVLAVLARHHKIPEPQRVWARHAERGHKMTMEDFLQMVAGRRSAIRARETGSHQAVLMHSIAEVAMQKVREQIRAKAGTKCAEQDDSDDEAEMERIVAQAIEEGFRALPAPVKTICQSVAQEKWLRQDGVKSAGASPTLVDTGAPAEQGKGTAAECAGNRQPTRRESTRPAQSASQRVGVLPARASRPAMEHIGQAPSVQATVTAPSTLAPGEEGGHCFQALFAILVATLFLQGSGCLASMSGKDVSSLIFPTFWAP